MTDFFQAVLHAFDNREKLISSHSVGGGCINKAVKLTSTNRDYFLKFADVFTLEQFEKESDGLAILRGQSEFYIPHCLNTGIIDKKSYLLLEWIESGHANASFWQNFGSQLASLHKKTSSEFGLDHDNYIGSLYQSNTYHETWSDFFVYERVTPQLQLALRNKLIDHSLIRRFELLNNKIGELVPKEPPALLHGDLWSGNFMLDERSNPVLVDPAIYYGHRETELAFTTLFGGFDPMFYQSYEDVFPVEKGFIERVDIHNLYPLLVHLNLFGSSYLSGILQILNKYT